MVWNLWVSSVEGNLDNSVDILAISSTMPVCSISLLQLFCLPSSDSHSVYDTLMPASGVSKQSHRPGNWLEDITNLYLDLSLEHMNLTCLGTVCPSTRFRNVF